MSDWRYVRIRSWHAVRTPTRMFDTYLTLCGRTAVTKDVRDVLPGSEKTCERCAVLAVKAVDLAPIDDDGSTWPESVP